MRIAAALLISLGALGAGGCGDRVFTPPGFVDAANAEGAELALGPVLTTTDAGVEVYGLESAGTAPGSDPNPQLHSGEKGSATMIVMEDSERARAEFTRCEAAPALTCFRAANVVLRFEQMDAADQARISGALAALAGG